MIFKTIDNQMIIRGNTFTLIAGNDNIIPLIEPKVDISDDILETVCMSMTEKTKKLFINYINKHIKEN